MPSFILTQCGWACYSAHNRSQTDKATCPGSRLSYLYSCMTQKLCSSLLRLALVLCFHWQTDECADHLEALCLGSHTSGTLIHLANPALARVSSPSHMVLALLDKFADSRTLVFLPTPLCLPYPGRYPRDWLCVCVHTSTQACIATSSPDKINQPLWEQLSEARRSVLYLTCPGSLHRARHKGCDQCLS